MNRRIVLVLCLSLALVLVFALVGCASSTQQEPAAETPAAEEPTGGSTGSTTDGQSGTDAQALVDQKCSMCHTIDRVNSATYDAAGWESTVARMERNGLVLTEEERAQIIEYLTQRDANP